MPQYEYKVVPAPVKGERARGIKGTQARFANTLTTLMNEMAAEGWEYLRADTLPCEERSGLTGKTTKFQNLLVFRRIVAAAASMPAPESEPAAPATPEAVASAAAASLKAPGPVGKTPEISADRPATGAAPSVGPARKDKDGMAAE